MNWYEELGRAIAQEAGITEKHPIEHQCGTVWVKQEEKIYAITAMETEVEEEEKDNE